MEMEKMNLKEINLSEPSADRGDYAGGGDRRGGGGRPRNRQRSGASGYSSSSGGGIRVKAALAATRRKNHIIQMAVARALHPEKKEKRAIELFQEEETIVKKLTFK